MVSGHDMSWVRSIVVVGRAIDQPRIVVTIRPIAATAITAVVVQPRTLSSRPLVFQTLLGLGTTRDATTYETIAGAKEIDILNRVVRAGDSVVHLSGIEQSLLYLLASRSGRVVSREEILDGIRGTDFVAESNIVDRRIRSLRIKLRDDYRHPRFIATVPREGYRFIPTFSNLGWAGGRNPGTHTRN
jgi:DNA-binding response OmpR family regulator